MEDNTSVKMQFTYLYLIFLLRLIFDCNGHAHCEEIVQKKECKQGRGKIQNNRSNKSLSNMLRYLEHDFESVVVNILIYIECSKDIKCIAKVYLP